MTAHSFVPDAPSSDDLRRRIEELVHACAPVRCEERRLDLMLVEDLGYTSLALMDTLLEIELEFQIEPLPEDELIGFRTVGDVVDAIAARAGSGETGMESDDVLSGVLEIARGVLQNDDVVGTSDFFELGGTSLAAMQMVWHFEERFAVHVSLTDFFDAPDFDAVAEVISERLASGSSRE